MRINRFAGLSPGRLQPERRLLPCPGRMDTAVRGSRSYSSQVDNNEIAGRRNCLNIDCSGTAPYTGKTGTTFRSPSSTRFDRNISITQRSELLIQRHRDLLGGKGRERPDTAGWGSLEPEPANELAVLTDTIPQARLRQTNHARLQRRRQQLRTITNPFGPSLHECQCAADPVQRARPLRVEHRRIHPFLQFAPRTTAIHSRKAGSNRRSRKSGAITTAGCDSRIRPTRPTMPHSASQGCLVRDRARREPRHSNASTFVSTDQFIVRRRPCGPGSSALVGVQSFEDQLPLGIRPIRRT